MTTHITTQKYIVTGIVDGAVMHKEAEFRRDHRGEGSIVHAHASGSPCKMECTVYEPGYLTRSVAEERVPVEEEMY